MTSKKAKDYLISLIERDTPKKIVDDVYPRCPVCDEVQSPNVYAMNNDFCPYCGQRLDWSD